MSRGPAGSQKLPALPATISMLAAGSRTRSVFSSLRFRLLLAVLVPFLTVAAMLAYESMDRREDDLRLARTGVDRLLNLTVATKGRGFDHARQVLATLAHVPCVRNLDLPACNVLFADVVTRNPRCTNIALVGPDGAVLASGIPLTEPIEVRGRAWFERAIKSRRLAVGNYAVGLVTGRPSLHIAQPLLVPETEEVRCILLAAIDLDRLAGLLPNDLPDGAAAFVLDSEGTILSQAGSGPGIGKPFPHLDLFDSKEVAEVEGPDGTRLLGSREMRIGDSDSPLHIALAVPTAGVLQEANAMLDRTIAALAVLALLSIGVWLLGDRFLVRRTQALVRVTRDLGAGRLEARAPLPYDRGELGELERAFNAMADSLQRRDVAVVESEGRFREIAETVQEAFWVASGDGRRLTYVSPAFEQIWGRPVGSIEGTIEKFFDSVDAGDRERVSAAAARMAEAGFREEYRIHRPSGEVRWISSRGFPVRDSEGRVVRVVGASEDITDRKRIEEQFLQAQKMEALGRLAGGVAHDFNNLLTIISGYADILSTDPKVDEETRHHLGEIIASTRRAASLTRQLLAFSRKQIVQKQAVDLNDQIQRMEDMLRRLIGEDIKLSFDRGEDLGLVMADPGHIEQVVMNLVVNARDAMPRGGTLRIETANVELDQAYAREHAGVSAGPHVMLAVSDTGIGMDAATRERLFEPFFTTKERGKGTGLGLATVYGIAKQSEGHIWVYSEPGHGSTFKVYFPRAASDHADTHVRPVFGPVRGGTETVLLVEDDPNLRRLIHGSLRVLGYTVLEAGDGAEAQRVSASAPDTIQLLVTDSVLPNLSGPALSRLLAERRPGLKVLFMSGYTDVAVFEQAGVEIGRSFLQKPFTIEALARKIRDVLDAEKA